MSVRRMGFAVLTGLLTGSVVTVVPNGAQAQDATVLPHEGGAITVVGCLQHGGKHDEYMLADASMNSVVSVPDGTCSAPITTQSVELKDTHRHQLGSMIGHWVEISGRLERIESNDGPDDYRELHLRSFRAVPVVPPRVAELPPAFEVPRAPAIEPPAPQAAAPPPEQPVATTGTTEKVVLPRTASALPLTGWIGLWSLAGAFAVRLFSARRARS